MAIVTRGLPQILTFHPTENGELEDEADQCNDDERDDQAEHPGAGQDRDLVTDIAAQQIKRAVRKIDVAHQAEDEREPARDHEVEAAERDPIQERIEENALAAR